MRARRVAHRQGKVGRIVAVYFGGWIEGRLLSAESAVRSAAYMHQPVDAAHRDPSREGALARLTATQPTSWVWIEILLPLCLGTWRAGR